MRPDLVVEIRAALASGKRRAGSGLRVSDRHVLTARHVTADAERIECRLGDGEWTHGATIVWAGGDDVDAALLELPGGSWPGAPAVRWGRLTGSRARVPVEATGFPRALKGEDGRVREHLDGHVNPGVAGGSRIDVNLDSAVPQPGEWGGMSGAALISGERMIGVIALDQLKFDGRRLSAVPVTRIAAEPAFRAALADEPVLESVELARLFAHAESARTLSVAMLLRADVEAVRFHGREHHRAALHAWCASGDAFGASLITGPGGQGKTRLAGQLCRELRAQGWVADFAAGEATGEAIEPLAHTTAPVLVVVDYAETRSEQLQALLAAALGRAGGGPPIRLLLLARAAREWWDALIGASGTTEAALAGVTAIALEPLDDTVAARERGFTDALDDLAAKLAELRADVPWAALASEPAVAAPPAAGSALELQMAALTALLQAGPEPVAQPAGPEDALRRHEHRYWTRTAADRDVSLEPAELLEFTVVAVTLLGAATREEAIATVGRLPGLRDQPEQRRWQVAAWLHDLYPAPAGRYWGALEPDRLGEHVAAHAAARTPELFGPALAGASREQARLALTVLARAAERHAHLEPVLADLVAEQLDTVGVAAVAVAAQVADPRPLISALGKAVPNADGGILAQLVDALPYQTVALSGLALDMALAMVAAARQNATGSDGRALLVGCLEQAAHRLDNVERLDEALAAAEEAVALAREAVAAEGDARRPALAQVLGTAAGVLRSLGRHAEAIELLEEAVAQWRSLAARKGGFGDQLARAIANLGNELTAVGRHEEALLAQQQAVAWLGAFAESDPDRHLPVLAQTLVNLAFDLGTAGRPDEAAAAAERALEILRPLAAVHRDAYETSLARALITAAMQYSKLERESDAVRAYDEALGVCRRLMQVAPVENRLPISAILLVGAHDLLELGRPEHARRFGEVALLHARTPTAGEPGRHPLVPGHVHALLGRTATALDRHEEACEHEQRAVELLREAGDEQELAIALDNLAISCMRLERAEGVVAAALEAVALHRSAAATDASRRAKLATSLMLAGVGLTDAGRTAEALEADREAVAVLRPLAAEDRLHEANLARALDNLVVDLAALGRGEEARTAAQEAVALLADQPGPELDHARRRLEWVSAAGE